MCGRAFLSREGARERGGCFGLGRPLMCREGTDVVLVGSGGCFCLGRVEWLRVWRKVLVGSGDSTLRRQNDPPGLKMPSGDGNTLQSQVDPPAPKLTAGATGSAGGAGVASSGSTWAFLSGAQQSSYQAAK